MNMIKIMISIIALTVMAPGHAKEVGSKTDLDCLARNIYYEAGTESKEGKIAVGIVTINRRDSGLFAKTICGVVDQHTDITEQKLVTNTKTITEGWLFKTTRQITETATVWVKYSVCQFSWRCQEVLNPIKYTDDTWLSSLRIARALLSGEYVDYREKYRDALYFHERHIKPNWAKRKHVVDRVGAHIFYADHVQTKTFYLASAE